jgi:predicted MPP superfamily phosphohydrolase
MMTFRRFLMLVTVTIHLPFAGAVFEVSHRLGLAVVLAALGVYLFPGRMRAGREDNRARSTLGRRIVDLSYFVHWCACLYTLFPAIFESIGVPLYDLATGAPPHLPTRAFLFTYLSGLVVCAYGILVRRRWFVVREIDVRVADLDPAFDGFRIAHLSDLHIGTHTPKSWGQRWVRAANKLGADIAVVTGDLVSSGCDFHGDIADVVGGLEPKGGVFVSMGNHDYFGDGEPLITLLGARGARVLRNDGTVLERNGASLYLAGIDDTWTKRDDIVRALRDRPAGMPTILLSHDPDRFPRAVEHGVALTLAGHTHGGQIALPFFYRWVSLARIAHRFNVGLYRKGDSWLYVHPGLGTTGPPMRLGVAPAVVILTLRAA